MSTGGTRKITRATNSICGFSEAFVVVLQKASFHLKTPTRHRLVEVFKTRHEKNKFNSSSVVLATGYNVTP